jgi:intracellular sulfur oxidation DsrE/DsrF family protein
MSAAGLLRRACIAGALLASAAAPQLTFAAGRVHKLALQVSDGDASKMEVTLSVAANVSRLYGSEGDRVDIVVVAFNEGLHMLRDDTSPVKARLRGFADGMPNVSFVACGMTLQSMSRAEKKTVPLLGGVEVAPAGVVRLLELAEQGYTIVRP